MSGIFKVALFSAALLEGAAFCSDPQALSPLGWPDARWPTGPRAGRPVGVAPCKGAVVVAALRLREANCLRFLISGNAKGFALSFPKAE